MALTTTSGSGTQSTTQSPQTNAGGSSAGTTPSNLQPGITSSLLTSQGGTQLHSTALPTVSLGAGQTSQTQVVEPSTTTSHHVNTALLGLPVILFLGALIMIWQMTRVSKKTKFI